MSNLEIIFGALTDPIEEQLKRQGVTWKGNVVKRAQKQADAVMQLLVHGGLTDSEAHKARQRIMKQLSKEVKKATKG